jgi:hypothetical protein
MPKQTKPTPASFNTPEEFGTAAKGGSIFDRGAKQRAVEIAIAPPQSGGDAVDLSQFDGELIALYCRERECKQTKFGERSMTSVYIAQTDSREPLAGIMFQSYFQGLELGRWYIGMVARVKRGANTQWVLTAEGASRAGVQALSDHLQSIVLEEEVRESLLED